MWKSNTCSTLHLKSGIIKSEYPRRCWWILIRLKYMSFSSKFSKSCVSPGCLDLGSQDAAGTCRPQWLAPSRSIPFLHSCAVLYLGTSCWQDWRRTEQNLAGVLGQKLTPRHLSLVMEFVCHMKTIFSKVSTFYTSWGETRSKRKNSNNVSNVKKRIKVSKKSGNHLHLRGSHSCCHMSRWKTWHSTAWKLSREKFYDK